MSEEDRVSYRLDMPRELYTELQRVATAGNMTVLRVIQQAIKLYLLAWELGDRPDAALIIRDGDQEREIVLP